MKIFLSTSTIRAYENRSGSMNLRFNPIVHFDYNHPVFCQHLNSMKWTVTADCIGTKEFLIEGYADIQLERYCIEFWLSVIDVKFQHDPYECSIQFSAQLNDPISTSQDIKHETWGIVKTIWSKGLQ